MCQHQQVWLKAAWFFWSKLKQFLWEAQMFSAPAGTQTHRKLMECFLSVLLMLTLKCLKWISQYTEWEAMLLTSFRVIALSAFLLYGRGFPPSLSLVELIYPIIWHIRAPFDVPAKPCSTKLCKVIRQFLLNCSVGFVLIYWGWWMQLPDLITCRDKGC